MAQLTDLPNELLLNIASQVAADDDNGTQSLFNLCQSSRLLHDIARSVLYTFVRIAGPANAPLRPLTVFLKTLAKHPSLANATRWLSLVNEHHEPLSLPGNTHPTGIAAMVKTNPAEIEPGLNLDYYDFTVKVLTMFPKLQHLHLTPGDEDEHVLLRRVHDQQASSSILSELKTLHVYKRFVHGPVYLDDYIPLFRYPSFEMFSTECNLKNISTRNRATNAVTRATVSLHRCIADLPPMRRLINACCCLKSFDLAIPDLFGCRLHPDVARSPVVAPRDLFMALLNTHGTTLETLYLDFHNYYGLDDPDIQESLEEEGERVEDCAYTYPSFHRFEKLTRLTIDFDKLVRASDLPVSLKYLNLQFCHLGEWTRDFLNDLIHLKENWCPAIEEVIVSVEYKSDLGMEVVKEHAIALNAPFLISSDDSTMTFIGTGRHLKIYFPDHCVFPYDVDDDEHYDV